MSFATMRDESPQSPEPPGHPAGDKEVLAKKTPKFVTGSLMRHVSVMSFTSSIGLAFLFAVDLVDMIFISMLGSSSLAAAIGYAGSILFFSTSTSIGVSIAAVRTSKPKP